MNRLDSFVSFVREGVVEFFTFPYPSEVHVMKVALMVFGSYLVMTGGMENFAQRNANMIVGGVSITISIYIQKFFPNAPRPPLEQIVG